MKSILHLYANQRQSHCIENIVLLLRRSTFHILRHPFQNKINIFLLPVHHKMNILHLQNRCNHHNRLHQCLYNQDT